MRRKLWFATTVSALVSVVFVIGIAPATGSPDSERRKTLHLVVSDPDLI
jgi:hypothetical protein